MDDYQQMHNELEYELTVIFEDLEEGNMLTVSQIDTLRYACGFPKKTRVTPIFTELFHECTDIFRGKK